MLTIVRTMLVSSLKDRISLFYSLVFPIVLFVGLGLYMDSPAYRERLLIGTIALGTLFWGMQGISFQVLQQRSKGVYKLLRLTPTPTFGFIIGMTMARSIIGIALNVCIALTGSVSFGISFSLSAWMLMLPIIVIGTLCFTCLGFLVANIVNNEGQINALSNLLQIPMIFGSAAFYSLEAAPAWLAVAGRCFPFAYFVEGMHAAASGQSGDAWLNILILTAFTATTLALAVLTFRWDTERGSLFHKKG